MCRRIGGVGANMIERARGQPGDGAGEGTGRADRAIRGLVIRDGRVERSAPDHTMFGRVGGTQNRDIAVAGGGGGGNVRDCLGGDGGRKQRGEGDILTIDCAGVLVA